MGSNRIISWYLMVHSVKIDSKMILEWNDYNEWVWMQGNIMEINVVYPYLFRCNHDAVTCFPWQWEKEIDLTPSNLLKIKMMTMNNFNYALLRDDLFKGRLGCNQASNKL